jgi:hypothetical protein
MSSPRMGPLAPSVGRNGWVDNCYNVI